MSTAASSAPPPVQPHPQGAVLAPLPRITIQFCTQCKWMLRAAYVRFHILLLFIHMLYYYYCPPFLSLSLSLSSRSFWYIRTFVLYWELVAEKSQLNPMNFPRLSSSATSSKHIYNANKKKSKINTLTYIKKVRPRAPLHILPLPRRSRPPALHRRNLHRHNPHTSSNCFFFSFRTPVNQIHHSLESQNRPRLPRDQGAQAPRQGRHWAREGFGPRWSGSSSACCFYGDQDSRRRKRKGGGKRTWGEEARFSSWCRMRRL